MDPHLERIRASLDARRAMYERAQADLARAQREDKEFKKTHKLAIRVTRHVFMIVGAFLVVTGVVGCLKVVGWVWGW